MLDKNRPKLFAFGNCDLTDILDNDFFYRDFVMMRQRTKGYVEDSLDFSNCFPPVWATSLMSLYTPPGSIAQRVHETLVGLKTRNLAQLTAYKEIAKYPYFKYWKENAGPNDYLAISFSSEMCTKIMLQQECWTAITQLGRLSNPEDPLHWLYRDYMAKEVFQLPFDVTESLDRTKECLLQFAKDVYEIFQDRVIVVKTHLSDLLITSDHKVEKVKLGAEGNVLFFKKTKVMGTPVDEKYVQKVTNVIAWKFCREYKADIPLIELEEPVFIDANHRWGYGPSHLDRLSCYKIGKLVHYELMKKVNSNKSIIQ
jgi:hypothetical protein